MATFWLSLLAYVNAIPSISQTEEGARCCFTPFAVLQEPACLKNLTPSSEAPYCNTLYAQLSFGTDKQKLIVLKILTKCSQSQHGNQQSIIPFASITITVSLIRLDVPLWRII